MANDTRDEVELYWKEKEVRFGGKAEYKVFARFLGDTLRGPNELTGLIYIIAGQLVFEDFEKQPGFLASLIKKKKETYQKTEIILDIREIRDMKNVSQGSAKLRLAGNEKETEALTGIKKFFAVGIHQFTMAGGESYFFEILSKNGPEKTIAKTKAAFPEGLQDRESGDI